MLPSLHLGEINIGIHVCQFTFEPTFYTFVSIQWRMEGFDEKKARIGGFEYPYSPPPQTSPSGSYQTSSSLLHAPILYRQITKDF